MSTIPTVSQPRTGGHDGWVLSDETVRRPALVQSAPTLARPTMAEIDDGWVLPDESPVSAATPAPARPAAAPEPAAPSGKLDLNAATFEELQALPGVGRLRARRILDLREQLGGFRAVEDLSQVRGVGAKTLRQLAELVSVG